MRWLNERTQNILEYLLHLSGPVSIAELGEHFAIARRTAYNEIDRANEWLRACGFSALEINHGRIYPFCYEEKQSIRRRLEEKEQTIYILSPQERVWLIVCLVLSKTDRILISDLLDTLEVSRTTLLTDLKAVQSFLQPYNLKWASKGKGGYEIEGNEISRRALYLLLLTKLPPIPKETYLFLPRLDEIQSNYILLKRVEAELKHEYIEADLYALAALLTFCAQHPILFEDVDLNRIQATDEFRVVTKHFSALSTFEQIYLTLHFLGSRLASFSNTDIDSEDQELLSITDSFIQEFQNAACVEFKDPQALRQALFFHIKASRYRYRYGIQISSPLEKDIRQEYPEVYRITQETITYLEQALQVHISEGEAAYLALHFGAFLALPKKKKDTLRILIVCVSGISAANMISREVRKLLPEVQIAGVESLRSLTNPHLKADLIISSVEFQALIPVLIVHPILSDEDRRNILNHPLVSANLRRGSAQTLYSRIYDLVAEENRELLKQRLEAYFFNQSDPEPSSTMTLSQALQNHLQVLPAPQSWKQALRQASQPLLDDGSIEEDYINTMIHLTETLGPYMIMTEEVMIAHAKPEEGVNCLGLALALFEEPVDFLGKPVRFLFVLGAIDQSAHFPLLKEIRTLFKKAESRKRLATAQTIAELSELLSKANSF